MFSDSFCTHVDSLNCGIQKLVRLEFMQGLEFKGSPIIVVPEVYRCSLLCTYSIVLTKNMEDGEGFQNGECDKMDNCKLIIESKVKFMDGNYLTQKNIDRRELDYSWCS